MKGEHAEFDLCEGDALILVDVQNDFLPGGALAVAAGDEVVPVANRYMAQFRSRNFPVFASRDWHPANHCSFAAAGGPWPPHCVSGTGGAAFAGALDPLAGEEVISKATRPDADAYSAFDGTDLAGRLAALGIRRVLVLGLATDYCVLATVRDALANGLVVVVPRDGVRAVDVEPGDGERALAAMSDAGAMLIGRGE